MAATSWSLGRSVYRVSLPICSRLQRNSAQRANKSLCAAVRRQTDPEADPVLLSLVSGNCILRWLRSALHFFRRRFQPRGDRGARCGAFPGRSAFSSTCTPISPSPLCRRATFGTCSALPQLSAASRSVRRLAVVRRFTCARFRVERVVAAQFLRFAICCLLGGACSLIISSQRRNAEAGTVGTLNPCRWTHFCHSGTKHRTICGTEATRPGRRPRRIRRPARLDVAEALQC